MVEEHDAPFWYSRIRSGVKSFFGENLDYGILDSLMVKLDTVVTRTTFQKNDCENSREAVKFFPDAELHVLPGSGHGFEGPYRDKMKEFAEKYLLEQRG